MVDGALASTRATRQRLRDLPSRVISYLLSAAGLFAELGYCQVWARLTAGLYGIPVATPSSSALTQARRRVGAAPLAAVFRLLAGPAAGAARWRKTAGLRQRQHHLVRPGQPCRPDPVPLPGRRQRPGRTSHAAADGRGGLRHPRTVIDIAFGSWRVGETSMAPRLLGRLRPGMLMLADRNFAVADVITRSASTGADPPIRAKNSRVLPAITRLPDGSWLCRVGGVETRVIDAEITATLGGRTQHTDRSSHSPTTAATPAARLWPAVTSAGRSRQRS
jgi:hypothetical protein